MSAKRVKLLWLPIILLMAIPGIARESTFRADSAFASLKHLVTEIGPRPMGSAAERQALSWFSERLLAYGAETAYVMPIIESRATNTNTGVAVGIFPGRSDSIIVIGGHIDSDTRENVAANDNASGVAVSLELARIWSQKPRRYTMVFAAFGGEEQLLVGSRWFADQFEELELVALMFSIDMAGADGPVISFIDSKSHQAPKWLVQDAYALDRSLGYNQLWYPTHFFSLNSIGGGIAGSDHLPFLKKGIPAMTLTSGVNTSPIHTPNDRLEFVSRDALARMGTFVDGLLAKYDAQGIPESRVGHYMMWQGFDNILFIPRWGIFAVIALGLLLAAFAFTRSRSYQLQQQDKERIEQEEEPALEPAQEHILEEEGEPDQEQELAADTEEVTAAPKEKKIKLSGLKLFVMAVVVAIFAQLGEAALQFVRGLRYPWYEPVVEYLIFAAIFAVAGFWAVIFLTRWMRLSRDPHPYVVRALVILVLMVLLLLVLSPRVALYPALMLVGVGLAVYLPGSLLKSLAVIAGVLPMFRLLFHEAFPFLARSLPQAMLNLSGFQPSLIYSGIITLVLTVWLLPLMFMGGYIFARHHSTLRIFRFVRHPAFGLLVLLAAFAYGGYLSALPAYNEKWQAKLLVEAKYNLDSGDDQLRLIGNEYFRGVEVYSQSFTKIYDDRINRADIPIAFEAPWFKIDGTVSPDSADTELFAADWRLETGQPWYEVMVELRPDTLQLQDFESPLAHMHNSRGARIRWFANPPDSLHLQAQFRMPAGADLIRTVTATYPFLPVALDVEAQYADVVYRTRVTKRDTIRLQAPVSPETHSEEDTTADTTQGEM